MKELITLITNTKPKQLPKKVQELRQTILDGKWEEESELADILWPDASHRIEYLRQTKERLLHRVVSSVFDLKETSPYQGKFAECHKELAAIRILESAGYRKELEYFAERLIKKALRYEITDVIVATADILYFHYASVVGNLGKSKKYLAIIEEYEPIQLAERKAQRNFVDLAGHFAKSRVGSPATLAIAKKYSASLLHGLSQYQSFRYHYFTYWVQSIYAELQKDSKLLLDVCDRALHFFQSKTYPVPNIILFIFGFQKRASFAIRTRDYDLAQRCVNLGMELMNNNPYNYSFCLIYQAMIGFHLQNNQLVQESILESKDYRGAAQHAEQWRIIDAYAHFLGIETDRTFRLGKFLNEVPIFSKDKQGLNITILVIQVLHYIKQGQYGALIDRWDALKKYSERYLKKDATYRSLCFLKMVLTLPDKNFHPVAIRRHTDHLLKRLNAHPDGREMELVPYELLWEEVFKCLELQHAK